jgi:ADP-ribosylglycohydrolase
MKPGALTGLAIGDALGALWCAWKWPNDYKKAVVEAVKMGGDADTRAAITGAVMGAKLGFEGIPIEYINGVEDSELLYNMDQALFAGPKGIKKAKNV